MRRSRAAQLGEKTGGTAYEPVLSVAHARLARIRGDIGAWEHHIRQAHRFYTEMGATGHAERAMRALGS